MSVLAVHAKACLPPSSRGSPWASLASSAVSSQSRTSHKPALSIGIWWFGGIGIFRSLALAIARVPFRQSPLLADLHNFTVYGHSQESRTNGVREALRR